MIAAIVAMSPTRVIGLDGYLPWHYPVDLKRFRDKTLGTTVIMGRKTWESLNSKALPKRRNIVITKKHLPNIETYISISTALSNCQGQVWFIGGGQLYAAALTYCDLIDVTHVPDQIFSDNAVYFPELDPSLWEAGPIIPLAEDVRLTQQNYYRRRA